MMDTVDICLHVACKGANEEQTSITVLSILTALVFFIKLGRFGNSDHPPQLVDLYILHRNMHISS